MNLDLEKDDLHYIGDSTYPNDDGNCVFVFYEAFGISRILLRNLLKLFGENYVILSEDEYVEEDEGISNQYRPAR